jgi:hypothetical protein
MDDISRFLGGTGVAGRQNERNRRSALETPNTSATNSSGFTLFREKSRMMGRSTALAPTVTCGVLQVNKLAPGSASYGTVTEVYTGQRQ